MSYESLDWIHCDDNGDNDVDPRRMEYASRRKGNDDEDEEHDYDEI